MTTPLPAIDPASGKAAIARRNAKANGASAGGTEAKLPTVRFRLIPFDKITFDTTPNYLVKGLIPREGLVVIWGPPKCGKSFWAFDLVMHVALDWEYRGRRVKQGTVVYVACEGERGLGARVAAFRQKRLTEDASGAAFHLLTTRLDLVKDHQPMIDDIRAQLGSDKPVAIVIDTLNRSIHGSESSDEDMGDYVKAADAVREAFGCAVLIIHHCGIDDKRPRGHTSLTGAADAQIAVKRDEAGLITTTVQWMKDGPEGELTYSRLEVVDLGQDTDGEEITSCVIQPADDEEPERRRQKPRVTGAAKVALDLLRRAIEDAGEMPPGSNHIPAAVRAVTTEVWRRYCYEGAVTEGDSKATKQKGFKRAADKLQAASAIGIWQDWVWIIV
jgi:KaiC/GvpD/RAD55 family RecA-like ATPase